MSETNTEAEVVPAWSLPAPPTHLCGTPGCLKPVVCERGILWLHNDNRIPCDWEAFSGDGDWWEREHGGPGGAAIDLYPGPKACPGVELATIDRKRPEVDWLARRCRSGRIDAARYQLIAEKYGLEHVANRLSSAQVLYEAARVELVALLAAVDLAAEAAAR